MHKFRRIRRVLDFRRVFIHLLHLVNQLAHCVKSTAFGQHLSAHTVPIDNKFEPPFQRSRYTQQILSGKIHTK